MYSPPLTPPASDTVLLSSPPVASGSRAAKTPASTCRSRARFVQWHGYSDEESEGEGSDNGLRESSCAKRSQSRSACRSRTPGRKTLCRGKTVLVTPTKSPISPSRFLVRGNVTPSRAAPLFRVTSRIRRAVKRQECTLFVCSDDAEGKRDEANDVLFDDDSDEDDEAENTPLSTPTKGREKNRGATCSNRLPLSVVTPNFNRRTGETIHGSETRQARRKTPFQTQILRPSFKAATIPRDTSLANASLLRPVRATQDVASYMHAMRSNTFQRFAGGPASGSLLWSRGGGVLSASARLGSGGCGFPGMISQRAFYDMLSNSATPKVDLFTLPSRQEGRTLAQPMCSEYANSARSLDPEGPQWLAVGNAEGSVTLIKTSTDNAVLGSDGEMPSMDTNSTSVFELKWRYDDEVLAAGLNNFTIDLINTSTLQIISSLSDMRGSSRSIAWDPLSGGSVITSGGRDGAIHVFDLRASTRAQKSDGHAPILSIWGAHAADTAPKQVRRKWQEGRVVRGVTSVAYVPGRGSHAICSASCGDGIVKLWDLRSVAQACSVDLCGANSKAPSHQQWSTPAVKSQETRAVVTSYHDLESEYVASPIERSQNVTQHFANNKSAHGISSMAVSSSKLFAASTDGCIYTLPCYDLFNGPAATMAGSSMPPLFDAEQRGNTLYARLALHDDERTLALGNSRGCVTVWDTQAAALALSELSDSSIRQDNAMTAKEHSSLECMAKPSYLMGHAKTFEINSVSWAHGPQGPQLASTSDDYTIRTWRHNTQDSAAEEQHPM